MKLTIPEILLGIILLAIVCLWEISRFGAPYRLAGKTVTYSYSVTNLTYLTVSQTNYYNVTNWWQGPISDMWVTNVSYYTNK